jgi:hypothetical protein
MDDFTSFDTLILHQVDEVRDFTTVTRTNERFSSHAHAEFFSRSLDYLYNAGSVNTRTRSGQ